MNAKTIKTESGTKELYKAILMLKNIEEMSCFFRDLLTESELVEFGLRWKVAQMLIKKVKYTVIEKETGLSSTTIARVQKWLNNGMGGYRLVIDRMHHHN
ncbi:MAG: YerC/YecD family TrpR-related protein [bacterium]